MGGRRRIRMHDVEEMSARSGERISARTRRNAHEQASEPIGETLLRALLKSPQPRQRARAAEIVHARTGSVRGFRRRRTAASPTSLGEGFRALPEARSVEEEERREKPAEVVSSLVPNIVEQTAGGRPLDPLARSLGEEAFGREADNVRVHTGTAVDRLARSIGRRAFSVGPHIFLEQSVAR
ncbi:MAG: DUF4157 domain-containing protein, partial [Chloroflexia bacterium]